MKQRWILGLFVALAISWSAAAQPTGEGAARGPALWVVRSGDAAVNLFGRMAVGNDTQLRPRIPMRIA